MKRKLLSAIGLTVAGALVCTATPGMAVANADTAPSSTQVSTQSSLTAAQKAQYKLDAKLAEKYTSGTGENATFNAAAAKKAGMSTQVANRYASNLSPKTVHPDESVIGCIIATAGVGFAEAALLASIFATGGLDAVAAAGFGFALASFVADCY